MYADRQRSNQHGLKRTADWFCHSVPYCHSRPPFVIPAKAGIQLFVFYVIAADIVIAVSKILFENQFMNAQNHNRFYLPPGSVSDNVFSITGDEFQHAKVKRLNPGVVITAVDGAGNEYRGEITSISKDTLAAMIIETIKHPPSALKVYLGIGIIRPGPMSFAVEKAVEAGVWQIIPLETRFSERKLSDKDLVRLNRISISALKQSGRVFLPEVTPVRTLTEVIDYHAGQSGILFADIEGKPLLSHNISFGSALILVGPEGGFSPEERDYLLEQGAIPVNLGRNRFRTETAALVAVAGLMMNCGAEI